eukprot:1143029-Pelagomonas_calceolata.AAC.1
MSEPLHAVERRHGACCTRTSEKYLDQRSPKIQGIEDSAWLSRQCLPGASEDGGGPGMEASWR